MNLFIYIIFLIHLLIVDGQISIVGILPSYDVTSHQGQPENPSKQKTKKNIIIKCKKIDLIIASI
jgi:hypothetical protein